MDLSINQSRQRVCKVTNEFLLNVKGSLCKVFDEHYPLTGRSRQLLTCADQQF